MKSEINLTNIKAYLQGNLRKLAEEYGPDFIKMKQHIREQVMFRKDIANPDCISNKECTECGCGIPELFYADKQCGGKCYPYMMSKEDWEEYKKKLSNYTIENKIEKVEFPFNWENINFKAKVEDLSRLDKTSIDDIIYDAGDVIKGNNINYTFTVENNTGFNKRIINSNTTCNCTTLDPVIGKYIEDKSNIKIPVTVDTSNKKLLGNHSVIVELTYNNKTKTKLIINYKIKENELN
jgi:hypothetical protein